MPRPRQAVLVERSLAPLGQHRNTLCAAPTGNALAHLGATTSTSEPPPA